MLNITQIQQQIAITEARRTQVTKIKVCYPLAVEWHM